jgi:hypothetical protein
VPERTALLGPPRELPGAPAAEVPPDLADLGRKVAAHQALIERLENTTAMLRERVKGLELGAGSAAGRDEAGVANAADSDADADEGPAPARERRPAARRKAPRPKAQPAPPRPARAKPVAAPATKSLPVKPPQRRPAPATGSAGPLPFSVEAVDRWDGEPRVVVKSGGRLVDVRPGESHGGWQVESAEGQRVTLRSPGGASRTVEAGTPQGSR